MKKKIICITTAILMVSSAMFIIWAIGLIIPKIWLTIIALIYCIYLIYHEINPKRKYYFITYWLPGGGRGRTFISCDKFKIRDTENEIAKDKGADNAVIDYYRQISKGEYEYNQH